MSPETGGPKSTAVLVTELKETTELTKESQMKNMYGASWALVAQSRQPVKRWIGRSLAEDGEEGPLSCGEKEGGAGAGMRTGWWRGSKPRREWRGSETRGGGRCAWRVGGDSSQEDIDCTQRGENAI